MSPSPELPDVAAVLAPLLQRVHEELVLQARGERVGAATWRAFARHADDPAARQVFLGCALLEEENAACLESLPAEGEGAEP